MYFSKGNLQYRNGTWRFAEDQLQYIGEDNSQIASPTNPNWIDLFGWGTGDNPTVAYDFSYGDYYSNYTEWGSNPISNGGNQAYLWRTLTNDEWNYLINTRTTTSGIRYAKATVFGVAGIIILPDDWSPSYYTLNSTNSEYAAYSSNIISLSYWYLDIEAHGAVFLPAAGYRRAASVYNVGSIGYYWSSSPNGSNYAHCLYFNGSDQTEMGYDFRFFGKSVRLVTAAE